MAKNTEYHREADGIRKAADRLRIMLNGGGRGKGLVWGLLDYADEVERGAPESAAALEALTAQNAEAEGYLEQLLVCWPDAFTPEMRGVWQKAMDALSAPEATDAGPCRCEGCRPSAEQRAWLAQESPTDAQVEAAVEAWASEPVRLPGETFKDASHRYMRAALEAARSTS